MLSLWAGYINPDSGGGPRTSRWTAICSLTHSVLLNVTVVRAAAHEIYPANSCDARRCEQRFVARAFRYLCNHAKQVIT